MDNRMIDIEEIKIKMRAVQNEMEIKFPRSLYTTLITIWQDGDFQIEVQNTVSTSIGFVKRSFYISNQTEIEYLEIIK